MNASRQKHREATIRQRRFWKLRLVKMLYERGYRRQDVIELFHFVDWLMILPEGQRQRERFTCPHVCVSRPSKHYRSWIYLLKFYCLFLTECQYTIMHAIQSTKQAIKTFRKMPANEARLIRSKIQELALDPFKASNVKKLEERPGYPLRVSDWRLIFEIHEDVLLIDVLKIGPRGDVYR